MRVGLFIPCYIDQFYPRVGQATLQLLRQYDLDVHFPMEQTCCGQPMANSGCLPEARPVAEQFVRIFSDYDYVVGPSGSCVAMVRHHYDGLFEDKSSLEPLKKKTFELCEFLVDVLKVERIEVTFPHRVGLHQSCHGLRELRLGSASEVMMQSDNKVAKLLSSIDGLELCQLSRPDECCGFGGTFAVNEEAVSCQMGNDRIRDHEESGTQVLASADMSCLMHLEGLIRRQKKPIQIMHVAEIFAGMSVAAK